VKEVIEASQRVTGRKIPVEYGPRRAGDPAVLFANADKIRQELGWSAQYTEIDRIIATAWKWHKSHPEGYGKKK
jgi:UDP-glucose 4-epimerase